MRLCRSPRHRHGQPRTKDAPHDFNGAKHWTGPFQQVFFLPPLLDGHQCEQQWIANSGLSWLREVAANVDKLKRLEKGLRANDIVEVCEATDVQIPGCNEVRSPGRIPMVIGKILKRIFSSAVRVEVGGYRIRCETREEYDPENRMNRSIQLLVFHARRGTRSIPLNANKRPFKFECTAVMVRRPPRDASYKSLQNKRLRKVVRLFASRRHKTQEEG